METFCIMFSVQSFLLFQIFDHIGSNFIQFQSKKTAIVFFLNIKMFTENIQPLKTLLLYFNVIHSNSNSASFTLPIYCIFYRLLFFLQYLAQFLFNTFLAFIMSGDERSRAAPHRRPPPDESLCCPCSKISYNTDENVPSSACFRCVMKLINGFLMCFCYTFYNFSRTRLDTQKRGKDFLKSELQIKCVDDITHVPKKEVFYSVARR